MTRIEKLRAALPEGFGAALVEDRYNRGYLTEFLSSAGTLLVTEQDAWLIVDFRYIEAAKARAKGVQVVLMDKVYEQVLDLLKKAGVRRLCVEQSLTIAALQKIEEKLAGIELDTGEALSVAVKKLRAVKEPAEVESIRRAQAITDNAFSRILSFIEPGRTEREIAAELEYYMRQDGADGMAFSTICVAGIKTSMPHGEPDENVVQKGDFVTMDFGAYKDGYCSDMTRTVAVGEVSDEQKYVYATVLAAHLAAQDAAKADIAGSALDKVARDIIYNEGFEGRFGHGLGHSLGLEVHEDPRASMTCDDLLPAGTIMTIEPGIYIEGAFGVRIENMVLITENGCENLTASPRELILL